MMLVFDMASKRERRPNVRLGEIGDVSAAFACGVSGKMMRGLWDYGFNSVEESASRHISGLPEQRSSEFLVSDPGLSSMFLVDMQHNRENKNPNSMKSLAVHAKADEIEMVKSKMNFGSITQKHSRPVVKGKRSKRCRRTVFGGPWNYEVVPKGGAEIRGKNETREVFAFASAPVDIYGSLDNQGSVMSKETLGNDVLKYNFNSQIGGNLESNALISESSGRYVNAEVFRKDPQTVGRWLEEVGFGRYAGVFEKHEVDEETLPLLTFEDLKEMGVVAIGPRRKLYALIRQLRSSKGR